MLRSLVVALGLAAVAWGPVPDVTTAFTCGVPLGNGIKSRRKFCDVVISSNLKDGVMMSVPAHTGETTLMFDLHNRYTPPPEGTPAAQVYAKHTAVVAVFDQTGTLISRAAVSRELRTAVDIFDRIGGGAWPDGAIQVAPGRAEAVTLKLPETVTSISVLGVSLELVSLAEQGTFTTPGRPVAIGSNFRIEYTSK